MFDFKYGSPQESQIISSFQSFFRAAFFFTGAAVASADSFASFFTAFFGAGDISAVFCAGLFFSGSFFFGTADFSGFFPSESVFDEQV